MWKRSLRPASCRSSPARTRPPPPRPVRRAVPRSANRPASPSVRRATSTSPICSTTWWSRSRRTARSRSSPGQSTTAGRRRPGPAIDSKLDEPSAVAVDSSGDVYISNIGLGLVVKVTPGGTLSFVAGDGIEGRRSPVRPPARRCAFPLGWRSTINGDLYISSLLSTRSPKSIAVRNPVDRRGNGHGRHSQLRRARGELRAGLIRPGWPSTATGPSTSPRLCCRRRPDRSTHAGRPPRRRADQPTMAQPSSPLRLRSTPAPAPSPATRSASTAARRGRRSPRRPPTDP